VGGGGGGGWMCGGGGGEPALEEKVYRVEKTES